jgi:hypothetical protein
MNLRFIAQGFWGKEVEPVVLEQPLLGFKRSRDVSWALAARTTALVGVPEVRASNDTSKDFAALFAIEKVILCWPGLAGPGFPRDLALTKVPTTGKELSGTGQHGLEGRHRLGG